MMGAARLQMMGAACIGGSLRAIDHERAQSVLADDGCSVHWGLVACD